MKDVYAMFVGVCYDFRGNRLYLGLLQLIRYKDRPDVQRTLFRRLCVCERVTPYHDARCHDSPARLQTWRIYAS